MYFQGLHILKAKKIALKQISALNLGKTKPICNGNVKENQSKKIVNLTVLELGEHAAPQKNHKFLSKKVCNIQFLTIMQDVFNMTITLDPTLFLKNSMFFRTPGGSCEKWQPISQRKGGFHPYPFH